MKQRIFLIIKGPFDVSQIERGWMMIRHDELETYDE